MMPLPQDHQSLVHVINQLHDMEQKLQQHEPVKRLLRNIERIRRHLEAMGYRYESPLGEAYDETRTDCEASIAGEVTGQLVINEVIKPLIRYQQAGSSTIVQRAVVIVGPRSTDS